MKTRIIDATRGLSIVVMSQGCKVIFMETADLTHHISRRFNEDLEKVRNQVLQMGGFVEQQLHKAITALVEGDSRLGEPVATDDYKVNRMDVSIHQECSRILAIP